MKPNTAQDTSDQQRLRAINDTIEVILREHNLGGAVLLVSRDSAAWKMTIPDWAQFADTGKGFVLRLQIKRADPEVTQRTIDTLHLIGSLRDMARDVTELFAQLFRGAQQTLKAHGAELEHVPFGGSDKHRPNPGSGETS